MITNLLGGKALNPSSRVTRYFQILSMLSRNAKLYLVAIVLTGLGSGIWGVIFNLYLRQVNFQDDFIGIMSTASIIATGSIALLAGLLCERVGPKRTILIGLMANLVSVAQIWVLQPTPLLIASSASGLIGTLSSVASAPFMAENSRPEERTHLFSFAWALMIIMGVAGSYIGGVMPTFFNTMLGLPTGVKGSATGYRVALSISIALSFMAVLPILLIKESKKLQKQKMADLLNLRNIKSARTIIKFMIPTAIIGFGAGFIVPLFNVFFRDKFQATDDQIGALYSLSSITLGIGTLVAPALSRRLTKARSVALCEYLSMPFIMLTTLSPNLTWAATAYVARNALMNMAGPIGTTLQMELVTPEERATTNGLMVMADNIPRGITVSVSGAMMTRSDFFTPFLFTTVTYFTASSLYFMFFRNAEAKKGQGFSFKWLLT
jgi:MFS family permease